MAGESLSGQSGRAFREAARAAPPGTAVAGPARYRALPRSRSAELEDDDPRGFRRWPVATAAIVLLVLVLLLVGGGGYGFWRYDQSQYYVGVGRGGYVDIFRGTDQELAGISLSSLAQQSTLKAGELRSGDQAALSPDDRAGQRERRAVADRRARGARSASAVSSGGPSPRGRRATPRTWPRWRAPRSGKSRAPASPARGRLLPGPQTAPRQRRSASRSRCPGRSPRPRRARPRFGGPWYRRSHPSAEGAGDFPLVPTVACRCSAAREAV